jgi:hypothetical protein
MSIGIILLGLAVVVVARIVANRRRQAVGSVSSKPTYTRQIERLPYQLPGRRKIGKSDFK